MTDLYLKANTTHIKWSYLNKYWSHLMDHCKKKSWTGRSVNIRMFILPVIIIKVSQAVLLTLKVTQAKVKTDLKISLTKFW